MSNCSTEDVSSWQGVMIIQESYRGLANGSSTSMATWPSFTRLQEGNTNLLLCDGRLFRLLNLRPLRRILLSAQNPRHGTSGEPYDRLDVNRFTICGDGNGLNKELVTALVVRWRVLLHGLKVH